MNPPSLCELRRGKPLRCCALGFMVPVRAIFCVGALHEPSLVLRTKEPPETQRSSLSSILDLRSSARFMVPIRAIFA